MSEDKTGKISISPNQIFKLDESDEERDYLTNRRRYLILEQLSSTITSNEKISPSTSITNTLAGNKIDPTFNSVPKCTKEVLSPSTATSNFIPFAGLRPFYPIHPSSYPYSLLSSSDVSQFSPW